MGDKPYNSSKTRVQPCFEQLYRLDTSGRNWGEKLLRFGSRSSAALPQNLELGPLKEPPHFEKSVPAPRPYLEWLVRNGSKLDRTALKGDLSQHTLDKRRALIDGDPAVIREALDILSRSPGSGENWAILEGSTQVDCVLAFENVTVYIEGKRKESHLTSSTTWYPHRSQVMRNLDCLYHSTDRPHNWYVLLVVEQGTPPEAQAPTLDTCGEEVAKALPHLAETGQLEEAWHHYLGFTTWQAIQSAFDLPAFPDTVDEASASI